MLQSTTLYKFSYRCIPIRGILDQGYLYLRFCSFLNWYCKLTSTKVRMSDITLPILGNINLNSLSRDIAVFANVIFNVPYDLYIFWIPLVHILSQLLPFYYDCCCLLINLQEPILQLCLERI